MCAVLLAGCAGPVTPSAGSIPDVIVPTIPPEAENSVVAPTPVSPPPGALVTDGDSKPVRRPVLEEIAANLSYFDTVAELREWLAEDDTNEWLFIDLSENQIDGAPPNLDGYDCDDYALQLQRRALASGYIMSAIIVAQDGSSHMINSCIIDRKIYYIEPQTDEFWLYSSLD